MTTIAYRDGVMAADTMAISEGGVKTYGEHKVFASASNQFVFGFAGNTRYLRPYTDVLSVPEVVSTLIRDIYLWKDICPLIANPDDCLVIIAGGGYNDPFILHGDGTITPYGNNLGYYAIGAGSHIALGAMYRGATSEEAIQACIDLNVETGGEVRSLGLHDLHSQA